MIALLLQALFRHAKVINFGANVVFVYAFCQGKRI